MIERSEGGGEATPILDLRTHNTLREYGASTETVSRGWRWVIRRYSGSYTECCGSYIECGDHKNGTGNSEREKKERATLISQLSEEDIERSLRRTRKTVRQKLLMIKPDKLLTFTTRHAFVETDEFKRVVSLFFKLCRKNNLQFQYVAVFERHMSKKTALKKFGSLHMHLATSGFVDYVVVRKLWRDSVFRFLKNDYEGSNFDSRANKRGLHSKKNAAVRIARYMSKYITKDIDDIEYRANQKRYWSSKGIKEPEKVVIYTKSSQDHQIFKLMMSDIFGVEFVKFFAPDKQPGAPPIIWMATA